MLGSVTHDVWKTGIGYAGAGGKIESLAVYGGAASAATLDTLPHGSVSGTLIRSPRVLVGYFSDWREGLESFGRVNGALAPPLHPWTDGVVFGFNTWAAYKSEVNVSIYQTVSDFLARSLMPRGFGGTGSVFVNWDAGGSSTAEAAAHVKGNGQRAGLYSTPFTSWGDGTDPRIVKDASGNPLPRSDGGYPLDPTHPEVKSGILSAIRDWKSRGYEYVKLDFVTHGIKEGVFHDKSITTGVAAYDYGLRYIAEEIAGTMFIDLAISPVFPGGQYVHARRVSCDAFGGIGNSEYLMNNAGYGWWLSGNVYQYNDPDHIVLGVSPADGNKVTTRGGGADPGEHRGHRRNGLHRQRQARQRPRGPASGEPAADQPGHQRARAPGQGVPPGRGQHGQPGDDGVRVDRGQQGLPRPLQLQLQRRRHSNRGSRPSRARCRTGLRRS